MYFYYAAIIIILVLIISPSVRQYIISIMFPNNNDEKNIKKVENFNPNIKKIVFSSYTADWCPHCVTFKSEIFGDLANIFSSSKKIFIKNVDCTNDRNGNTRTIAGNPIEGYPTLIINTYDKNNNMEENVYTGARDANSIAEYLKSL